VKAHTFPLHILQLRTVSFRVFGKCSFLFTHSQQRRQNKSEEKFFASLAYFSFKGTLLQKTVWMCAAKTMTNKEQVFISLYSSFNRKIVSEYSENLRRDKNSNISAIYIRNEFNVRIRAPSIVLLVKQPEVKKLSCKLPWRQMRNPHGYFLKRG
jgi:hypothetical protein